MYGKRKKRRVDAQASKRAEIFKCRQTHLSKKDHFIIISGEKGKEGEETLKRDGTFMVRC